MLDLEDVCVNLGPSVDPLVSWTSQVGVKFAQEAGLVCTWELGLLINDCQETDWFG